MSNIQKTLDSLQPYVIGIRFVKTTPVVDIVLNEGWTVLDDSNIQTVKGDEGMNYHMIFSDKDGYGLDELLDYVERTIKANLDREKKHELLKAKVNELKEIFKKNNLTKLQRLRFSFGEEDLMPSLSDIDDDLEEEEPKKNMRPLPKTYEDKPDGFFVGDDEKITPPVQSQAVNQPEVYLDENNQPIPLTEEEMELIEEERRAEINRQIMANKKQTSPVKQNIKKVELPPKRKVEMVTNDRNYDTDCECGPNDACEKCIDSKGY